MNVRVARKMMIVGGRLEMLPPIVTPVASYLQRWQRENGIKDGEEVSLVRRDVLERLVELCDMNVCG